MSRVGVLALQGSAGPHADRLRALGAEPVDVRGPEHLDGLTHLVMPGGESTTLAHLLTLFGLWEPIVRRHGEGKTVLLGTCAGAILLGWPDGPDRPPQRMGLLDAQLARNAYGRQTESFNAELDLDGIDGGPFPGVFIRAPRFVEIGADARVVARHQGEPVLVEGQGVMAATFHPELTDDLRIHQRFLAREPAEAAQA